MTSTANGRRTQTPTSLDELGPVPQLPEGPFKTPVTDALRAQDAEPPAKTADHTIPTGGKPSSQELYDWWIAQAESEMEMLMPKAVEYGGRGAAIDLIDMGHDLARLMGRKVTDQDATEIAIAIYVRGKISRIMAALMEGRMPNVDSWLDLGVYARMAQRNRAEGGWPYKPVDQG